MSATTSNRKTLQCGRCGRPVCVGIEAVAARCWACTGFVCDPPAGTGGTLEEAVLKNVHRCANFVNRTCIVRKHGRCVVLDRERCGWFEKAVNPKSQRTARACQDCGGVVPKYRRYCERCGRARQRASNRETQRKKRVSCHHSVAPTPPNSHEFAAAPGTFQKAPVGVAARTQNSDKKEKP